MALTNFLQERDRAFLDEKRANAIATCAAHLPLSGIRTIFFNAMRLRLCEQPHATGLTARSRACYGCRRAGLAHRAADRLRSHWLQSIRPRARSDSVPVRQHAS